MSTLSVFKNPEGVEIVIDTLTGESFASQRATARMCKVSETAIRKFVAANLHEVKRAVIQTDSGLQGANLLSEDTILACLGKYNSSLITSFAKLGLRAFLHQQAGYKVTSTATTQQQPKSRDPHPLPASLEAAHLARFIAETAGCNNAMAAQLAVNAAIAVNPALTPARDELKVAVAVTDTEEDALLNATQIGELVNLSARKVNLLLIEKELQYKSDEKNIPYRPTEKGKEFSRMVPSVAKHKDQSVFQLRWRPEVAELLKANQ